jgi:hypothetical protein
MSIASNHRMNMDDVFERMWMEPIVVSLPTGSEDSSVSRGIEV